jgi:hypothetical protein
MWQQSAEQNAAAFKEESVAPTSRLQIFAFVQANSPILQFVHTLEKLFDMEAAPKLRGKVVVFVGKKLHMGPLILSYSRNGMHGSGSEHQCAMMQ